MFFDSFFCKNSEISFDLIAGLLNMWIVVLVRLKHIWESILDEMYSLSEVGMCIFRSAFWSDGFFIDVVLVKKFIVFPDLREY